MHSWRCWSGGLDLLHTSRGETALASCKGEIIGWSTCLPQNDDSKALLYSKHGRPHQRIQLVAYMASHLKWQRETMLTINLNPDPTRFICMISFERLNAMKERINCLKFGSRSSFMIPPRIADWGEKMILETEIIIRVENRCVWTLGQGLSDGFWNLSHSGV